VPTDTANYNSLLAQAAGNLVISKATLTIKAADRDKTYWTTVVFDETTPSTDFIVTGLGSGDTVDSVTLTSAGAPVTATVALSPYPITPSAAVGTGLGNYTIGYVTGNLTVNPAPLAIIGLTSTDKSYDGNITAPLSGSAVLVGVVSPDMVTVDASAATADFASKDVGMHAVTLAGYALGGADQGNYALSAQPVVTDASITPATLVVSADDQSRAFGLDNPNLTASYSGFVGGETLATSGVTGDPDLNTAAVNNSPAGNYPITAAVGSLSAVNYNFSFADGTLTVFGEAPGIKSVTVLDPTHVVIYWSAISNVTYRVQYRPDLDTDWADLVPDVTATSNTALAVDNPAGAQQRFYRILVVP
jgi:trimeric autotransporter adhesin